MTHVTNVYHLCKELENGNDGAPETIEHSNDMFEPIYHACIHKFRVKLHCIIRLGRGQATDALMAHFRQTFDTNAHRKRVRTSPIVEMNVWLNASSENLNNIHVLPTPESPIRSSLNNRS